MRFIPASIPGVVLFEPDVHRDRRGFFFETYRHDLYAAGGIADVFMQDNHTGSVNGTLRGLHMQIDPAQAKLVRVVAGEIYDVAVDLRPGSPTLGQWVGVVLSADNFKQCYIPAGFAHGFCVTSDAAEVAYKCSELYAPKREIGIAWDDPFLAIRWPIADPILSDRDRSNPPLAHVVAPGRP